MQDAENLCAKKISHLFLQLKPVQGHPRWVSSAGSVFFAKDTLTETAYHVTGLASGEHCGPAALGLSGARRQLGGGRPRGEGRGRSARGARPPGRGPGYAQALDEILPTNKSDLFQLAATQTAGLVVGNLRSSACAALRAARVAMMALIISFACHTVWH